MEIFAAEVAALIGSRLKPADDAAGGLKKNYTEALSHDISRILAATYPQRLVDAFNRRNPFY
jgi:hypothetical protein